MNNINRKYSNVVLFSLSVTTLGTTLWIVQYPVLSVNELRKNVKTNDIDLLFPAF
jgi:3D (Asp-Asp-Asp) domain-containing protein